jgi:hypothetical protein
MFALCNGIRSVIVLTALLGAAHLPAASVRWVHLGSLETGLAGMAVDGKVAYQKMPPGKATPWGEIQPGLRRFHIASAKSPGNPFEIDIEASHKITIVSVADKNGDIQSRTYGLEKPQGEIYVLNMLPGAMIAAQDPEQMVIAGKGFWLADAAAKTTVSLTDGEGFAAEVDFTRIGASPKDPFLAVLFRDDEGKATLAILRSGDSLFEMTTGEIVIPDELSAVIRVVSAGNVPAEGSFDPATTNWELVESRIFWLNLMIDRDPCRLEIRGFPAMRRMPSGRGSGFVKWPEGMWKTDIVVERTGGKLASDSFSLASKSSVGLISCGGGKHPHSLLALEGRPPGKGDKPAPPRIRFVNALPAGVLHISIPFEPEQKLLTLESGKSSEVFPIGEGGFPGAKMDFSLGNVRNEPLKKIAPVENMPAGDWVVVAHLHQESFDKPVLTWVEMDKGSILSPAEQSRAE